MKTNFILLFAILFYSVSIFATETQLKTEKTNSEIVDAFIDRLKSLSESADNDLLSLHFQSMIDVIEGKEELTTGDISFIQAITPVFSGENGNGDASEASSYYDRERPLIIAWISPTDGKVSFGRLKLPVDWNPNKSYPLYIELHGLWSVADNPIDFMTYSYRNSPSSTYSFEDGYAFFPWGRGNFWYQGLSETDIWEGIDVLEGLVTIDQSRKYLTGHSMGGYGAWNIGANSTDVWAGLGIHAGALWYGGNNMLSTEMIQNLGSMPVYFVCGTNDGLYDINLSAYNSLMRVGNYSTEFVSFAGGHDYFSVNVENMYLWLKQYSKEGYVDKKTIDKEVPECINFYPNHIRDEAEIQLNLEQGGPVLLTVVDVTGRETAVILDREFESGNHRFCWNKGDLTAGVYIYSLVSTNLKLTGRIIIF